MTATTNGPKVTLGFVSCERLNYLRATLESARACLDHPNLEWIVVGAALVDTGLVEYVRGGDWTPPK